MFIFNNRKTTADDDKGSLRVFFLLVILIWPSVAILSFYYVSKHFSEIAPYVFFVVNLLKKFALFFGEPPAPPFFF